MYQEDILYEEAKDNLKKYGRIFQKSANEKVIYECAAATFSIRQEYEEDTSIYNMSNSIYIIYREMILKLQSNIKVNEELKTEAEEACLKALSFIELTIGYRLNKTYAS